MTPETMLAPGREPVPPVAAAPEGDDGASSVNVTGPAVAMSGRLSKEARDMIKLFLGPDIALGPTAAWPSARRKFKDLQADHIGRLLNSIAAPPGIENRQEQVEAILQWIVSHARGACPVVPPLQARHSTLVLLYAVAGFGCVALGVVLGR